VSDEPRYEIEPEPDAAGRAAIVAALERLREQQAAARSPWTRAARDEVVDDGLG
jgi:hypothetical protein